MMLSAVVITLNEERNVGACLDALAFCDERIVVDSGSRDRTVEIARSRGARIVSRAFDHFAAQKNAGADAAMGDWILSVDADERAGSALAAEIRSVVGMPGGPSAYRIPRDNHLFGRHLRFGGNQNDAPIRLFRKHGGAFEGMVHESVKSIGRVGRLRGSIAHYSTASVRDYFRKLNLYAGLEAAAFVEKKLPLNPHTLTLKPFFRFFQRYFVQMGVLDGREGFVFCALSGYYEFVRHAKHWELLNKR